MRVKTIIKFCALAAALIASAGIGTAPAHAQGQVIELKLSHFVPPQHTFHKWAEMWAQELAKESNGRLKLTIYPNGQLVGPPNRQFDAARNGIVDMAFVLHGVTPGRYPMTELGNLPFAWPSAGATCSIMSQRLTELAPKYLAAEHQGLHILYMAVANPVLFYSKKPIRNLEDFKGLKIRYAGIQNEKLVHALGATPLLIQPPDAQDALAKGIVDAAMFPHEAGLAYDLASVVKYVTEPGVSSATFALVMNPAKYQSLPPDLRAIIDRTTGVAGAVQFGKMWEAQEIFARNLETKNKGLQIETLSAADIATMKKLAKPEIEEALDTLEKQGKPAREFFAAYTK